MQHVKPENYMTNKKITLPPDLEEFTYKAERKNNVRALICAVLFVLCAYFLYLNASAILKPENRAIRIFFALIFMSLPFIITGFPHKTSDKTFVGVVEKCKVETHITGGGNRGVYYVNVTYLTTTTPDGKKLHKKFYTEKTSQKLPHTLYKIGDTVFHLCGAKCVVVLPRKNDTHFECAVCENVNEVTNTVCRVCGHTLIKNVDSLFCESDNYSDFSKIQY